MSPNYRPRTASGWGINEAEYEARQLELERLSAIPEYQKHQQDKRWIERLLVDLLFAEEHSLTFPPRPQTNVTRHTSRRQAKPNKPDAYGSDGLETLAYTNFKLERRAFSIALFRYVGYFRSSQWDKRKHDRKDAEVLLGAHAMEVLRRGFKRAEAGYDVGASLYLYQQMYDRKLCTSPSLSRAAWLVKNAPLRRPVPAHPIPRGKWQRIQEQWKDHFGSADYWAAIATTTKSPLHFIEEDFFTFVCEVDVDQLKQIANAFLDFRVRVVPPKVSATPMYLKQGLSSFENEDKPPIDIPNPLEDFQWEALLRYSSSN